MQICAAFVIYFSLMPSIQFRNKESLLDYYNSLNIETWAIFHEQTKCFSRGKGSDNLDAALQILESGASNSIYTLRMYDGKKPEAITAKLEPTYSTNFRLNGENMTEPESRNGVTRSQQYHNTSIGRVHQMLEDKIAKKMMDVMEGNDDKEPPADRLGIIGEILDHPVIGSIVEKLAVNWLNGQVSSLPAGTIPMTQAEPMRAVGNIATDKELVAAIETLKKIDPKLTLHLQKLAQLAENDPATFKMLIGTLEKM